MKFFLSLFLVLGWPLQTAHAWDFATHFIMAQRAYDGLTSAQQSEAQRLIAVLSEAEPATDDFVAASVWLDAQSWNGFGLMQHWHYQPQPWLQGPYRLPQQASDHALWVLNQALQTLRNPQATDFQKALMLRVFLHVSADLHQPLHAIERFSPAHPTGDRGGSDFSLQHELYRHLHALWDAAGGQYVYLSLNDWPGIQPQIKVWADELAAEYPCSAFEHLSMAAPEIWATEAYALGQRAYQGILPGSLPESSYLIEVQQLSRRQMALAACRVSAQLALVL